ncbi:MAG TPA: lysophospholipid acyltransferase family protein [Candidatus Binatia bacterium]|nr:lysophospholipid acyltransferase family protein [Candidatus Binatia bacterium]
MIRTVIMVAVWALALLLLGPPLLVYSLLTSSVEVMYRIGTYVGISGVKLIGVKVDIRGLERLEAGRNYIFMSNHVSNLDPPVLIPSIPGRCSVLVKKEVFRIPILGLAMRMADLVPVDRRHRESAIESVRAAVEVMRHHIHMVIFVEGTRSWDGRLLPFKKGPFHLAMEVGAPVVPVTILGTYECWPKGKFVVRPGTATVVFHPPIDPAGFSDREELMATVRETIAGALPQERR